MLVTYRWLQEYVEITESAQEIADLLTRQGLEVSACDPANPGLEGIVTGRILSIEPHPDAERLTVCRLDMGSRSSTVVCGASNIKEGDIVPVAGPGVRLPGDKVIEAATIRGVPSEGMLCSEREMKLSEDHEGIMLLPQDTPVGHSLVQAMDLDDYVLEIDLTPNRPDCLSVIGVAREIAAKTKRELRLPEISVAEEGRPVAEISSVEILAPDSCHRYVARIVEGVRVAPSPFWLRRRLALVGVRPINNIVDVTNLVLMEWGQPLHAFDLDRLEGERIVVRKACKDETIATLDGIERKLSEEDLLICDARKPVALAGVMGGQDSEIQEDTTRVLIESAFFEPIGIRRTAKRLGLSTEASYRFEREIDKQGVGRAADRTAQCLLPLTGGRLLPGVIDAYPVAYQPQNITVSVSRVGGLLGISLGKGEILEYLKDLEFDVRNGEGDCFEAVPPSFRPDVKQREDVIEEVARLHGYDSIPVSMPKAPLSVVELDPEKRAEDKARDLLVGLGFLEVINLSFHGRDRLAALDLPSSDPRCCPVAVQNPLSEMQAVLRPTLIGSLLDTVSRNLRSNNRDPRLFELRKVFLPVSDSVLPQERRMLTGAIVGSRFPARWNRSHDNADLFDLKGVLEVLFDAFGIDGFSWNPSEEIPYLHPGCSGDILVSTTWVGQAGKLHPAVQDAFDIEDDVYLFDLEFSCFTDAVDHEKRYRPFFRNPSVQRDIAIVLDEDLPCGRVLEKMRSLADKRVTDVEMFDLYQGSPVPEGKKSLAFRITYQDSEKNLTDEEVNDLQEVLLLELLPSFEARLR